MSQRNNASELDKAHTKLDDLEAWFSEARTVLLFSFHPIHAQVQSFPHKSSNPDICYSPDKQEFTPLELEYITDDLKEKQFFAIVTLDELLTDVRDSPETVIGRAIDEYCRGNFSPIIEEIKTANSQQISSGLQFQAMGNQKYFTAVEAIYAALEFMSDWISHIADLSREWESVEIKSEKEVSRYYWTVRTLVEDLSDTITPIVSNGRDVQNLFERQKIGYKAWLDQRYGVTEAYYGLPESVIQEAEKIAKQEAEAARRSRLTDASDRVRLYTPDVPGPVFCEEMTKRILEFGQVLKDDGWYRHLSHIQAPWTQQHQIDAFREAIEILQTAISGDGSTVLARLKNIYETDHIEDASLRTAKRDYRQCVFDALRREILFKLTEREYSTSKDQAKHYQDTDSQFQAPGWGTNEDNLNANQADKLTIDDDRGYTAAQARKQLGLKDSQFSHYRSKAGVASVKKGKTYSTNAVVTIARYIYFRSGAIQETKDFCRDFLNEHGENLQVS